MPATLRPVSAAARSFSARASPASGCDRENYVEDSERRARRSRTRHRASMMQSNWDRSVDVGASIPSPPRPPGRVIRAYNTTRLLPFAVAHAWALIRPTRGVGTSTNAICGLISTQRGCHCFRRCVEERSGA
jgi:hypothetical protein